MKKILLFIFITTSILCADSFDKGMSYFIKGQYQKALPHFTKASNNGHKQAQFYLANIYEKGLGVRKNPKMAAKLYKKYTSKKISKTNIKTITKFPKKAVVKKKVKKKAVTKVKSAKISKKVKNKSYSKKYRKHYNPNLQGAKEVIFN